eukprot:jgi/Ulvmu1/990/UM103_0017.1
MLGATVVIPTLLVPAMGGDDDDKAQTIQSIFFASGLNTLLQTTWGDRLPIIQGGSFSFLTPAFAIIGNVAERGFDCAPDAESCSPRFRATMRELSGAIIGASLIQVAIGYSGLMGFLLKYISPLTIAPTIALVGLALIDAGWGDTENGVGSCVQIGIPTIVCLILFSQYLRNVQVNLPRIGKMPIFALFPVLFSIAIMWIISIIYTEVGDPDNEFCRSDSSDVLSTTPWIRVPYPGQWGRPTFSASSVFAMFAGVLAGMIESVGDYYACARLAGAPPPPVHAISRGIGAEGIGCIISGLIGTTNGTTSYSENVGAIGLTGVGSRRVIQTAACIMIVLSVIGKFGALFASLPTPIVGGLFCVMFGMIAGVGLANMQYANQASMRNIFILGFALFNGLSIPDYFSRYTESEGHGPVNTGSQEFNDIINTLLETPMAVALLLALLLDNTLPGTWEERGLHHWNLLGSHRDMSEKAKLAYDLPFGLSEKIEYPILDQFSKLSNLISCGRREKQKDELVASDFNPDGSAVGEAAHPTARTGMHAE